MIITKSVGFEEARKREKKLFITAASEKPMKNLSKKSFKRKDFLSRNESLIALIHKVKYNKRKPFQILYKFFPFITTKTKPVNISQKMMKPTNEK